MLFVSHCSCPCGFSSSHEVKAFIPSKICGQRYMLLEQIIISFYLGNCLIINRYRGYFIFALQPPSSTNDATRTRVKGLGVFKINNQGPVCLYSGDSSCETLSLPLNLSSSMSSITVLHQVIGCWNEWKYLRKAITNQSDCSCVLARWLEQ